MSENHQRRGMSGTVRVRDALLVAAAATLVYLNALPNGFAYDDAPIVMSNPVTAPDAPWGSAWLHPYWPGTNEGDNIDVLYRPLTVQTYALQRRWLGDAPLPFHALNVLLHAGVSVGVLWLAIRLGCGLGIARLVALIFAVHPIHVEAVANVVGRAELMSTAGWLCALWATDRWCAAWDAPRSRFRAALPAGLGAVAGALVAMTSKESGVAVVALVVAWMALRGRLTRSSAADGDGTALEKGRARTGTANSGTARRGMAPSRRRAGSAPRDARPRSRAAERRAAPARWVGLMIPLILVLSAYLVVRYEVCGSRLSIEGQRVGPGNPLRQSDAVGRLLTPVSLIGRYVGLMFWPARLLCDYSADVIRPTRGVTDAGFLIGALFGAVVIVSAIVSARGRRAGLLTIIGGIATYALASNTFLLIDVIFAERIFYAPSIWLCVGLGLGLRRVTAMSSLGGPAIGSPGGPAMGSPGSPLKHAWHGLPARVLSGPARVVTDQKPVRRGPWWYLQRALRALAPGAIRPGRIVAAAVLVALAGRTVARNPAWRNSDTLFRGDLAAMDPGRRSAHLCYLVAGLDARGGDLTAAEGRLLEAIAIDPDYPDYFVRLGEVYMGLKRYAAAVTALERAHLLERRNARVTALLDRARRQAGGTDVDAVLRAARRDAIDHPKSVDAARRWARAAETADPEEAVRAFTQWARVEPVSAAARKGLALAQAAAGRRHEAVETLSRIIARSPEDWEAHTNLAVLLMDKTDADTFNAASALAHARRAVELNPTGWQTRVNLAEVIARCGDPREAAALFDQLAAQCPPGSDERRLYRDRAAFLRGRGR